MYSKEVLDLLSAHSTVREFSNKPVTEDAIASILACTKRSPTSSICKPILPTSEELKGYDEIVSAYFYHATQDKSNRGWFDRTEHAISTKPRYEVAKYLKKAGFLTRDVPDTF